MYATRRWMPIGLLPVALLAGCLADGGRGSSGFDITENLIIARVLETQECVSNESLIVCPADRRSAATPTPTGATPTAALSPTATPTVEPTPQVDTGLADGASIACTRSAPGASCMLSFGFAAYGFAPDATFVVASRLRAPDSDWVLAAAPVMDMTAQPPRFVVPVDLPVPADAVDPQVQFAVLIFLEPPDLIPQTFAILADSGTDFAFVTPQLALEIITTQQPSATATVTAPETETETEDATATPTEATPIPTGSAPVTTATATATATATTTATATSEPLRVGPQITYFGVARADSYSVAPSGFDGEGRPIYVRAFGYGMTLVVEGAPGPSGRQVAIEGFSSVGLPDLQLILSRGLGNGSTLVCDRAPPILGGVPASVPFDFSDSPQAVAAINDFGCRSDDGQGNSRARSAGSACTLDRDGEFSFVDGRTTAQYCLPIAVPWGFPLGDTIVAARLRDVGGNLGARREIVIRNVGGIPPTPAPTATITRTARPTVTGFPLPTGTITPTRVTHSPTPTSTPRPAAEPLVTHLGLARADDIPLEPGGVDPQGRPIYLRRVGQGMTLVVEARQGMRPLGVDAYNPDGVPDLEVIVSRPLGNGSALVCDELPPIIGGVPATSPLEFRDDPAVTAAVNDLGCRFDDGAGAPSARRSPITACTVIEGSSGFFGFVDPESQLQYCMPIALSWSFPDGDTIVAARVRDVAGQVSAVREIVVRVGRSQ